ncbi:MAG: hypothetical protein SF097_27315 [Acidobacteriota bacterium]|nr:hypothetical protein [Acidobacteriota bacterium]
MSTPNEQSESKQETPAETEEAVAKQIPEPVGSEQPPQEAYNQKMGRLLQERQQIEQQQQ